MILKSGKWFGWLVGLALWPVLGWGQEILVDPQNATVCLGEEAIFTSSARGGFAGWHINDIGIDDFFSPDERKFFKLSKNINDTLSPAKTDLTLTFKSSTPIRFSGMNITSGTITHDGSAVSEHAYLFYKTNQQSPATDLTATANDTAIQVDWDASEVTAQYLVSIRNITETPVVVDSPHYVYLPESQDCRWYEFMVTVHECFNSTDLDTRQNTAASVRVAYPNISPVSLEVSGDKVLVDWLSGDNSALAVVASLRNGSKTLMTHTGTLPFSYVATGCGQYNLNVTVSPAQCEGEPDFTQSASIGFTILCPTRPTEPETEVTGESSGTLAMYPSLLAVVAVIPLLKWQH